jgi:putative DNA primase/helicase
MNNECKVARAAATPQAPCSTCMPPYADVAGRSDTMSDFRHATAARACAVPIEVEIERRGINLRGRVDRSGPCPKCGGIDRFSINVQKQVFNCRGCGVGGDVVTLVQHLDSVGFAVACDTLLRHQSPPPQHCAQRSKLSDDYPRKQHRKAEWLWSQRKPIVEDTPPALYLRKRGYTGLIPATLGYLPAWAPHPASMIAAFGVADEPEPEILAAPKCVRGVHLTRLTAEGDKAPNADGNAKIMVGTCKGAPITISPPNDLLGMAVTEGIEDGLSVYQATGLGVWAAGAAGFIPALAPLVPDYIEAVTVYAHEDDAGRRGALELARALDARGIEVFVEGVAR